MIPIIRDKLFNQLSLKQQIRSSMISQQIRDSVECYVANHGCRIDFSKFGPEFRLIKDEPDSARNVLKRLLAIPVFAEAKMSLVLLENQTELLFVAPLRDAIRNVQRLSVRLVSLLGTPDTNESADLASSLKSAESQQTPQLSRFKSMLQQMTSLIELKVAIRCWTDLSETRC